MLKKRNMAEIEEIKQWAESNDAEERANATKKISSGRSSSDFRNTPFDILIKLSDDENEKVRGQVAGNKNSPKGSGAIIAFGIEMLEDHDYELEMD